MAEKPFIVGIIPARMSSTRLPGKALAQIHGMPMIGHVYHRSKMCKALDGVYLAVSGKELEEYADSIGAPYIPDGKSNYRGCSNAIADATLEIEKKLERKIDIVVLIQGDEPMIIPEMIDAALKPILNDSSINVVNLMAPIKTDAEHNDPNCPKVVVDRRGFAMYFSREPIPSLKKWKGGEVPRFKQVCVIPFRRDYLLAYSQLEPGVIEEVESIDMNRVLEYGDRVRMVRHDHDTHAVDTAADLIEVAKRMEEDPLIKQYG